jgi:hypothetical protein
MSFLAGGTRVGTLTGKMARFAATVANRSPSVGRRGSTGAWSVGSLFKRRAGGLDKDVHGLLGLELHFQLGVEIGETLVKRQRAIVNALQLHKTAQGAQMATGRHYFVKLHTLFSVGQVAADSKSGPVNPPATVVEVVAPEKHAAAPFGGTGPIRHHVDVESLQKGLDAGKGPAIFDKEVPEFAFPILGE